MVQINGKSEDVAGVTLSRYLEKNGYIASHIAVERNLEIVSKSDYDNTVFQDGDVIEIVSFVGGGCR